MSTPLNNEQHAPGVIRGAKRLQRAFYKRMRGPWENVVTPWQFLSGAERAEFLHMAALFHAAEYFYDGNVNDVITNVALELRPKAPITCSPAQLAEYVAARYAEYNDPYLDKD